MKLQKIFLAIAVFFIIFANEQILVIRADEEITFGFADKIDMIDSTHGWALYTVETDMDISRHVLITNDGASTWHDITPPSDLPSASFCGGCGEASYFFYDTNIAWAFYHDNESPLATHELWLTRDAGQSWTRTTSILISPSYYYQLNFVDNQHGWILGQNCCAMGNEIAILFRTEDGGQSWNLINVTDWDNEFFPEVPHRDLGSRYHTGIVFYDSTNGWISITSIGGVGGGLLQTHDGGESWQYVMPPFPDDYEDDYPYCDFRYPRILSDGAFAVVAFCDSIYPYIYETKDEGQNWTIIPLPYTELSSYANFAFDMLNSDLIWLSGEAPEENEASIYHTTDGGNNWVNLEFDMGYSPQMFDFIDAQEGWTLANGLLYHTSDGGQSWSLLHTVLAE